MKILITGAGGMTGSAVCSALKEYDLLTPKKHELNVSNLHQVMRFSKENIYAIVHLAAETDHEYCEENPSQCYFVNTIGTANMCKLAQENKSKFIYISAGSIFDGESREPYSTIDFPNPVNHYNSSKYYGELIAKDYWNTWVVRAGWMFGGGPKLDKKFVNKIITKIRNGHKEILVCDDCIGSPTYTKDIALFVKEIVDGRHMAETYHCSNHSTGISRYDFALMIVKALKSDVKITRCKIDDLKAEFPCKRTNYEVLESDYQSMPLEEAINEYITEHYI